MSTELAKAAVDQLVTEQQTVTIEAICRKSLELDLEGRGIKKSAVLKTWKPMPIIGSTAHRTKQQGIVIERWYVGVTQLLQERSRYTLIRSAMWTGLGIVTCK